MGVFRMNYKKELEGDWGNSTIAELLSYKVTMDLANNSKNKKLIERKFEENTETYLKVGDSKGIKAFEVEYFNRFPVEKTILMRKLFSIMKYEEINPIIDKDTKILKVADHFVYQLIKRTYKKVHTYYNNLVKSNEDTLDFSFIVKDDLASKMSLDKLKEVDYNDLSENTRSQASALMYLSVTYAKNEYEVSDSDYELVEDIVDSTILKLNTTDFILNKGTAILQNADKGHKDDINKYLGYFGVTGKGRRSINTVINSLIYEEKEEIIVPEIDKNKGKIESILNPKTSLNNSNIPNLSNFSSYGSSLANKEKAMSELKGFKEVYSTLQDFLLSDNVNHLNKTKRLYSVVELLERLGVDRSMFDKPITNSEYRILGLLVTSVEYEYQLEETDTEFLTGVGMVLLTLLKEYNTLSKTYILDLVDKYNDRTNKELQSDVKTGSDEEKETLIKKMEELETENRALQERNEDLSKEVLEHSRKLSQLSNELNENKDSQRELGFLRKYFFEHTESHKEIRVTELTNEEKLERLRSLKIVILGGHVNVHTSLRQVLPKAEFIADSDINKDFSFIPTRDIVFVVTVYGLNHSMYEKLFKYIKGSSIKMDYLDNSTNRDILIDEIYRSAKEHNLV